MEQQETGDGFHFGELRDHAKEYINNRIEYYKLVIIGYIAKLMPVIVFAAIMGCIMLIFWLFINAAAAIAIGRAIGSVAEGFAIIAGFNFLIALILSLAYKTLIFKPVSDITVKILIKSLEADEDKLPG